MRVRDVSHRAVTQFNVNMEGEMARRTWRTTHASGALRALNRLIRYECRKGARRVARIPHVRLPVISLERLRELPRKGIDLCQP